jgi:predicted DNA binding CopG/RHH family protein
MSKVKDGNIIVNGIEISEECLDKIKICSIQKKIKPYQKMISVILEKSMRTKSFEEIDI